MTGAAASSGCCWPCSHYVRNPGTGNRQRGGPPTRACRRRGEGEPVNEAIGGTAMTACHSEIATCVAAVHPGTLASSSSAAPVFAVDLLLTGLVMVVIAQVARLYHHLRGGAAPPQPGGGELWRFTPRTPRGGPPRGGHEARCGSRRPPRPTTCHHGCYRGPANRRSASHISVDPNAENRHAGGFQEVRWRGLEPPRSIRVTRPSRLSRASG